MERTKGLLNATDGHSSRTRHRHGPACPAFAAAFRARSGPCHRHCPACPVLAAALRASVGVGQGRTYAGGLTKFEPREMERVPVPSLELLSTHPSDESRIKAIRQAIPSVMKYYKPAK